jgi:hypothetical protein
VRNQPRGAEKGGQAIFFKAWLCDHFLQRKQGASPAIKAGFSQVRGNAAKNSLVRGRNASRLYHSRRGGYAMGLTRPINALMICAAFVFIAALIMGVLP